MDCTEARELLDGHLDNELDAAHTLRISRHLETCERCRAVQTDAVALRAALKENAPRYRAPLRLRKQILASLDSVANPMRARQPPRAWAWARMGAAFALAVLATFGLTYHFAKPAASDLLIEQALATHVRGILSGHPIDVASSDRHTVKPWLSARLEFSPPVADFAEQGFALAGGRLDYLDGRPVATLIYQHKQHLISVFVWTDAAAGEAAAAYKSKNGYNLAHWMRDGFRYFVVSDVSAESLRRLVALLQG